MNTVTVAMAAEPHLVTTVTNSTNTRSSAAAGKEVPPIGAAGSSYSAGAPTLVTNGMMGGGRTNPAGPQVEEEGGGMRRGEDSHLNLLNFSPDEHEPLLSREQLPAESEALPPPAHHHHSRAAGVLSGRGSNSNNNNNRLAPAPSAEPLPAPDLQQEVQLPAASAQLSLPPPSTRGSSSGVDMGPCFQQDADIMLTPKCSQNSEVQPVQCPATAELQGCKDPDSATAEEGTGPEAPVIQTPRAPETPTPFIQALNLDPLILTQDPKPSSPETLQSPASEPGTSPLQGQEGPEDSDTTAAAEASGAEPAALQGSASEPQTAGLMRSQVGQNKARRPERPCSLDLSSTCISTGESEFLVCFGAEL